MLTRKLFSADHEQFRDTARKFFEREIMPHHDRWEEQGFVDREAWLKAGAAGLLCMTMPEAYGGVGVDRLYSTIMIEEAARVGASGPGFSLHSEIASPYINRYGSEAQKQQWLPRMARGEIIGAIAMTEPGAGSDLQSIRTTAIRDGDHYVLNGSKTYITNGHNSDLVIVVCKTDPTKGAKGTSLLLVEADRPGFSKGKRLKKLGLKAQDTSELFFDNVKVPAGNLLGREGEGFMYLMQELPWERMMIALRAVASAEAAVEWTLEYTRNRKAFGKPVFDFQTTRHKLAECKTQVQVGRAFADQCLEAVLVGQLDPATAAMAKYWCTDMQCKVIDECLQLHGGSGYMLEYPITRAYADARVQRIYGGTNEIMKEVIGRSL
ncbi:MAG TPA: acyl-CoA dehydrogenase family protein [Burkholderiaceae bacterium]|nr:acyl-CoA dehydrogenase family protein [Burkholderiaceae bacterium]